MSLSYSRPENSTEYLWCLCFSSPTVRGRVKEQVFFFLSRTEQNCQDKQTLPCKVKTQHLRCVLMYWFSLAAIGRQSKEDGAMCAGPRELGEIQAALCTPREWGLAYIECLCCRIESVEHLCLNSLTVKLGLTKNPPYTNRKWSRDFFFLPFFFFAWNLFLCGKKTFFLVLMCFSALHRSIQLNCKCERWRNWANLGNRWRIMCWKRWSGGERMISIVCLLKGRAHMGDRAEVYVD